MKTVMSSKSMLRKNREKKLLQKRGGSGTVFFLPFVRKKKNDILFHLTNRCNTKRNSIKVDEIVYYVEYIEKLSCQGRY